MTEVVIQIGDGVPEEQLKRLNTKEFIRCRNCAYRDSSRCTIMDGLNITDEFFCGFAQKISGEKV